MPVRENDKFGKLTVIKVAVKRNRKGKAMHEVACECGNKRIFPNDRFRRKDYPLSHCGCDTAKNIREGTKLSIRKKPETVKEKRRSFKESLALMKENLPSQNYWQYIEIEK